MAIKHKVSEGIVKSTSLFDFKETYKFIFAFLSDYGYDVKEKSYSEKIKPEGKEIEIKWDAGKNITDYFKFVVEIDWLIVGMAAVELQKEKIKIKLNRGDIRIRVRGFLERDYERKWETTPFLRFIRDVYDKYIIKNRIGELETMIREETDELIAQLKSYLALESSVRR